MFERLEPRHLLVIVIGGLLALPLRASAAPPDAGAASPADLREQGVHYLKVAKRDLARKTLEKALQIGGADDERLILVLSKLHHEDGNIERAFEVLAEGPETDRLLQFREQLAALYGRVRFVPVEGGRKVGPIALNPDAPIINTEKKSFLAAVMGKRLKGQVKLPLEVLLPTGRFHVNGRPFEVNSEGLVEVEVPFYDIALILSPEHSSQGRATQRTLEHETGARIRYIDLKDAERSGEEITKAAIQEPQLIIALGFEAAKVSYKSLRSVPLILLGVTAAEGTRLVRRHGKATAIWSDLPRRQVFEKARELYPKLRRVGMLFRRRDSWASYQDALEQRPDGIRLVPILVKDRQSIAGSLLKIRPHVDALWLLPNAKLLDERAVTLISMWGLRESLPVIAEEVALVQHGAMLSAGVPAEKMIAEGLATIRKLLWDEEEIAEIPVRFVDTPAWGLNTAVADELGVKVPDHFLEDLAVRGEQKPTVPKSGD